MSRGGKEDDETENSSIPGLNLAEQKEKKRCIILEVQFLPVQVFKRGREMLRLLNRGRGPGDSEHYGYGRKRPLTWLGRRGSGGALCLRVFP